MKRNAKIKTPRKSKYIKVNSEEEKAEAITINPISSPYAQADGVKDKPKAKK